MRRTLFSALIWIAPLAGAMAQPFPGAGPGPVPPVQWQFNGTNIYYPNGCVIVGPSVPCSGNTKLLTSAATAAGAGLNIGPGVAPTSPINGDLWMAGSGFFAQINGTTVQIGSSSASGTAGQLAYYAGSGTVVAGNPYLASSSTAALTITPPSGTTAQGLLVNPQTGPTSCPSSCTSSLNYNEIDVSNPGYGVTGSSLDAYGLLPSIAALRVNFAAGGANQGGADAILGASRDAGSSQNLVGGLFSAYANITDTSAPLWGLIGAGLLGPTGSVNILISVDCETAIAPGGVVVYHYGCRSDSSSTVQGSTEDAAFAVEHDASPPGYGGTSKPWKDGLLFTTALSGLTPLDAAGNVIHATATFTTGCLICMPDVTFSSFLIDTPSLVVTGAGVFTTPIVETINQNTATAVTVNNNSTGNTAVSGLVANNSANSAAFVLGGTGQTTNGTVTQNRAYVYASSGTAGIALFNAGANPIVTAISGAEVGRWDSSTPGQLDLGLAGATNGALSLFNSTSTGATKLASANVGSSFYTATLPNNTGALAELNLAQTWSAVQTFSINDLVINGGSATAGLATVTSGGVISSEANAAVAQGGTGQTSLTSNAFLTGNGTGAVNQVALTGIVTGNGASAPTATNVTGAVKDNGSGTLSQAACADLSDCVSGSFTPAVVTDGTTGTPAYATNSQVGSYTKTGSRVIVQFFILLTGWTGSPTGNVSISGFPVPSSSATTNDLGSCNINFWNTSTSFSYVSAFVGVGSSQATLKGFAAGGATTNASLTAAQAGTTFGLSGVCIYHT